MTKLTRRAFTSTMLASAGMTAACGNGIGGNGAETIDARVNTTLTHMYDTYPNTADLAGKSAGMLVMPLVTEAGLGVGGGYGRGALLVNDITVDYYSITRANVGFQIGAQQFAHVLFFMTQDAMMNFRRSSGWAAGADLEYVLSDQGNSLTAETTTVTAPVIAIVFGRAGLRLGATLEGGKYTRIIP